MHRTLALLLALTVAWPGGAQQPKVSETMEVRLLEVNVTVTDRGGNPVHGLTAGDFELFENGQRKTVTNVSEYREATIAPTTGPAQTQPAAQAQAPQPRTIVLLVDPLVPEGGKTQHLFDTIRSLLEKTVRPGDRLQALVWYESSGFKPVLHASGPDAANQLDALLKKSLSAAEGGPSIGQKMRFAEAAAQMYALANGSPSSSGGGQTQPELPANSAGSKSQEDSEFSQRADAEREFARMKRKTASMQRIVSSLTSSGGKAVVVYVSDSFPRNTFTAVASGSRSNSLDGGARRYPQYDTQTLITEIVRTANANGVAFYALRPNIPSNSGAMLSVREEQALVEAIAPGVEAIADQAVLNNEVTALSMLTEPTGGSVGVGPQGIERIAETIARDLGSYYSLGWRAASDGSDRERSISVRAKNADYTVRTRTTLVEKSEHTRVTDLLVARLFEQGPSGGLEFDVKIGTQPGRSGKRVLFPVELAIPVDQLKFAPEGNESAARFSVLTVAGESAGKTTKVTRDSQRAVAPQGQAAADAVIRYTLQIEGDRKPAKVAIGVYDERSGIVGVRTIDIGGETALVTAETADPVAAALWHDGVARAESERKPLVVFFRPKRCGPCENFERQSLPHPTIVRRTAGVVFVTIPFSPADTTLPWPAKEPGLGVFDRTGTMRAKWIGVPDSINFGAILDAVINAGPNFDLAVTLDERDGPYAGASQLAIGLLKLGRTAQARAALDEAVAKGSPENAQLAAIALTKLDARGNEPAALKKLDSIIAGARSPRVAAEAWSVIAMIEAATGDVEAAEDAYRQVIALAEPGSAVATDAAARLGGPKPPAQAGDTTAIRIIPPDVQIVAGRQTVRTLVNSPAVARVVFTLDGKEIAAVDRPPFSTQADFSRIPRSQLITAVAYDREARAIGSDERRVNDGGDVFWVRMHEPAVDSAMTSIPVSVALRAPAAHRVTSLTVYWNDAEKTALAREPWSTSIAIRPAEVGVLRVVAHLDDGRTAEDAVPINVGAFSARTEVQMVELPVTISAGGKPPASLRAPDVIVQEGATRRNVEAITGAPDVPVTIGILIDTSESMYQALPDVQEAAIRFLDSALRPEDRAFVVSFDTKAGLIQPATSDREALRRAIMSLRPHGLTALNDAMILGLLQFEGVRSRRALVVFTDGFDRTSRYEAADLNRLSQRMNVPIYAIAPPVRASLAVGPAYNSPQKVVAPLFAGPSDLAVPGRTRAEVAMAKLDEVARASGGYLEPLTNLQSLDDVYDRIGEALRAQMLITIRTDSATAENEWRPITVSAARRGIEVRAPAGYYAPR